MDKTAIDESDDFGTGKAPKHQDIRSKFTFNTLWISLIVTTAAFAADIALMSAKSDGLQFVIGNNGIPIGEYQTRTLLVVGISQISFLFFGLVAIVVTDRWAWAKYASGSGGRIAFEAVKWFLVTLLFLSDAYLLERIYEVIFI